LRKAVFDVDTSGKALRSKAEDDCCYHGRKEKSGKPVEDRAFAFGSQVLKNVFDVDPAGDALRSFPHHGAQKSVAALVDERDFVQVHDASTLLSCPMIPLPACPQFSNPRLSEAAL
jgi:hypothetical protein